MHQCLLYSNNNKQEISEALNLIYNKICINILQVQYHKKEINQVIIYLQNFFRISAIEFLLNEEHM